MAPPPSPPRVERTRSEASLGSPHSTKSQSPRKEATDAAAEVVPFDRPDAIAASWYQRRLPRLVIAPVAGRARQQPPPRRQETVSVPPRG